MKKAILLTVLMNFILFNILFAQVTPSINLVKKDLPILGQQARSQFIYDYFASPANLYIVGNKDNSYFVAYLNESSKFIHIISLTSLDVIKAETIIKSVGTTNQLVGFTRNTKSGNFYLAYLKDNKHGDKDNELHIAMVDGTGNLVAKSLIFGDKNNGELWSKGTPTAWSTCKLMYNEALNKVAFFVGHTMRWDDNVRHQASYFGLMDENCKQLMMDEKNPTGNTWFCSHDFEQRLIAVDSMFYTLSQGDFYPRALVFAGWKLDGKTCYSNKPYKEYYSIPKTDMYQDTKTETGGLIALKNGTFGIVYGSFHERKNKDLKYVNIDKKGDIVGEIWLTQLNDYSATCPKIARFNDNILIAWQADTELDASYFRVIDKNGKTIIKDQKEENVRLFYHNDLYQLANNQIIWAEIIDKNLRIYKITP